MAKKRTIELWERGTMFGEHFIAGFVDGRRTTAILRGLCQGRVWVSWHSKAAEEVLVLGMMKPPPGGWPAEGFVCVG